MAKINFIAQNEGRYDRHHLIDWWDQRLLANARVLVAGAGALGNEVLKLLALIGVGYIQVVDFDVVTTSNLSRTILFRQGDIGRPKAVVAAERLSEINPDILVHAVPGDLRFDIGLGDYRKADIIFGCLDSVNARWALNRKCMQAGVEWIDAGISDYHGLIARYSPHTGACYECNFSTATFERFHHRYSCPYGLRSDRPENKTPTTAITTSAIAAIQVQQGLMMLHDAQESLQPGERLMLYIKPYHLVRDTLPHNQECLAHSTLPADIASYEIHAGCSIQQFIQAAQQELPRCKKLYLPYEFITDLYCAHCDLHLPVKLAKERLFHSQLKCPDCGDLREPTIIDQISIEDRPSAWLVGDLGLPQREILTIASDESQCLIQVNISN